MVRLLHHRAGLQMIRFEAGLRQSVTSPSSSCGETLTASSTSVNFQLCFVIGRPSRSTFFNLSRDGASSWNNAITKASAGRGLKPSRQPWPGQRPAKNLPPPTGHQKVIAPIRSVLRINERFVPGSEKWASAKRLVEPAGWTNTHTPMASPSDSRFTHTTHTTYTNPSSTRSPTVPHTQWPERNHSHTPHQNYTCTTPHTPPPHHTTAAGSTRTHTARKAQATRHAHNHSAPHHHTHPAEGDQNRFTTGLLHA